LLELLGNIADNACKYCRSTVRIEGRVASDAPSRLLVRIEDDGPGVPEAARTRILERGVRADETTAGQGLGLSMARDIVAQYDGRLTVTQSQLGGAQIDVELPGRRSS
jgi:two-component system sensor histidine kinase PhoQ